MGFINFISEYFFPCALTKSVFDINYDELFENGTRALLFDVDNTLAPFDMADPPAEIYDLFKKLNRMGFKLALISNNKNARIERFGEGLNAFIVSKAGKPGVKGVERALAKLGVSNSEAVIIGDQIFTDIWCANKAGIYSVLVQPVSAQEEFYIKFKRLLEHIVMRMYFRKKKSNIAYNNKKDYNGNGFTLLECIVTLAISVTITCTVLYTFPAFGTRELEEACRTLQADLRMAQRLSVIEGQRYKVEFDCVNNSYTVGRYLTASSTETVKKRKYEGKVKLVYLTGNTEKIEYTPTGTTGDACKITLENDNYYVKLTINLGSGRIDIKEFVKK